MTDSPSEMNIKLMIVISPTLGLMGKDWEKKIWRQVCLVHNFMALGLAQVSKVTVLTFSRVLT